MDAFFFGGLLGQFVAGVGVAGYAYAGVVVEDAGDFAGGHLGSVGDGDLAGVERVAHAYSAAVVEADPGGAGSGIEQRVEDGPVSNGVAAVEHLFSFAIGAGDGAGVEVVAADGDGRGDLSLLHEVVHRFAHLGAFAVA